MTSNVSLRVVSEPFLARSRDIRKRTDRATMYAVRESARRVKQEAKRNAPVYGGARGVRISAVRKARKAGVNLAGAALGKGELVEGNQIVRGLLRDSISSARRLRLEGRGTYSVRVGPRGPRVYKYAAKIEAQRPFMRTAYSNVAGEVSSIHAKAWQRSMSR